jgi:hypothetical protein
MNVDVKRKKIEKHRRAIEPKLDEPKKNGEKWEKENTKQQTMILKMKI